MAELKLTVNLTPKTADRLEDATDLTGDSTTDTVNRAVQVYAALIEASANGWPSLRLTWDAGGNWVVRPGSFWRRLWERLP